MKTYAALTAFFAFTTLAAACILPPPESEPDVTIDVEAYGPVLCGSPTSDVCYTMILEGGVSHKVAGHCSRDGCCVGCIDADGQCRGGNEQIACGAGGNACISCGRAICYSGSCSPL